MNALRSMLLGGVAAAFLISAVGCDKAKETGSDAAGSLTKAVEQAADKTKEAASTAVEATKEAASTAMEAGKEVVDKTKEVVKDATGKSDAKDAADNTKK